jgi:midasin
VGQAENQELKSGHQGIVGTKDTKSRRNLQKDRQQQRRKMGNTDEERTLGEVEKMEKKTLKTEDKLNRDHGNNGSDQDIDEETQAKSQS